MTPGSRSPVTAGARSVFTAEGLDWYASLPAAPAARLGDLLVVSGQVPLDEGMNIVAPGDLVAQTRYVFESIARLLEAAGATFDDVVDVIAFTQDPRQIGTVLDVARAYFDRDYPAWSIASFLGSYVPGVLVCIQAIAHLGPGRKECFTPDSLRWWGSRPVSGGCRKGDLLFVSAQSAIDPDGNVLFPGDHSAQARCLLRGDPRDRRHGRRLRRRHPRLHLVPPGPARRGGDIHGRLHARGAERRVVRRAGPVDEPRRHARAGEAGATRRVPRRGRSLARACGRRSPRS